LTSRRELIHGEAKKAFKESALDRFLFFVVLEIESELQG
jgi:hypothetical protein